MICTMAQAITKAFVIGQEFHRGLLTRQEAGMYSAQLAVEVFLMERALQAAFYRE
jgi:hypothetical protein